MRRAFRQLFTGKDGETYDVGRVLWVWGVLSYTIIAGWAVIKGHAPFDPMAFGGGFAAVLAAGAGGIAMKAHTEPDPR